ncbi:MAG: ATP-dependent DNA helicase RecG [Acidimicrobiia bacterium]|nr:ATP-dependent DNA helicase RecG [Acidimicrobiia bacterium]
MTAPPRSRTSAAPGRPDAGGGSRPRRLASLASIPVTELRGVGPKTAANLQRLGVHSVLDLLWHVPRRYIDRSTQPPIGSLRDVTLDAGEELTLIARVQRKTSRRIRRGLTLFEVTLADDTGTIKASWFNQPGRARLVEEGATVAVSGDLTYYRGRPKFEVKALEPIGRAGDSTGGVVPVHPAGSGVTQAEVREYVRQTLDRAGELFDPVPEGLRRRHGLVDRTWAFRQVHFPDDLATARRARTRLVYDELFVLEVALACKKRAAAERDKGFENVPDGPLGRELVARLPYELTRAQQRVLAEIAGDLASPAPMHRLVQGEVGSGKTVVAALAMLAATDAGRQAALMAPTEVLAEQHHRGLSELLAGLSVPTAENLLGERPLGVGLLTNRTTEAERRVLLDGLSRGEIDVLIGTHALIQDGVRIPELGVVVVDEQHRFGVHQRVALRDKQESETMPDVLIMTATPIPRTLSMTLYGDLDVSVIDELPPGRQPIETVLVAPDDAARARAYAHVRAEVEAGRQAYVICPLVEESEQLAAKSATSEYERLAEGELTGLRLGLLHGQLRPADKAAAMDAFRAGDVDVLVATTVVEVGVDVPNASVLIVEDADRFGLSQLHQLRGRIGRGSAKSTCYLFCDPQTPDSESRMAAMAEISDGFRLAEADLEIRGEGSLFGARQHGATDLHVARLLRDFDWVQKARTDAFALVDVDPRLSGPEHALLRDEVAARIGDDVDWLMKS